MSPSDQLDLFAAPAGPFPEPATVELGRRLPRGLLLGTSSWSFPGWAGIVYARRRSTADLARDGLAEYARHPLLRTVCLDRGYYAPIPAGDFERYASQLPPGFRCVMKAWEGITTRVFPRHERYGARAGQPNPHFLDPEVFAAEVLGPLGAAFRGHAGPVLLEFAPAAPEHQMAPADFAAAIDAFFARVPRDFSYAVEIRDRRLLTPGYLEVLRTHEVAHTLNYWSWMPTLAEQLRIDGIFTAPTVVARLMLPPGTRYAEMRERMAPFDRIVRPDPAMRQAVVDLWRRAAAEGREVFVIANNKAEGSAPLTLRALAQAVVDDVPF